MAEYTNAKQSIYSDLEPEKENIYSQPEDVDSDHSDKGSVSGRGSDRGSVGRRNGSSDHGHHGDRDGDRSDREDSLSDRGSRRSDHGSRQSDHGSRRSDHGSRRSDREDGRSDSHSTHDREGSLHDSVDGTRDRRDSSHDGAGDVYEALDEMNDLVTEAEQNLYINEADDRKSNDSHSDGEGEGHRGRRGSAVGDNAEAIYEEVRERQSDSDDGSEKGGHGRGQGRHSDDLYDDVRDGGHARENGHQQHRRGSHDSDDENHRSTVDGGLKRQTSSNAPTSSGKFMLRTSRKADALHVLRRIRDSSSAEDNPEMDELVTVLRSTDHSSKHEDVMDEENEKIKSFITSKLIHKFEQGIASEDAFNENHDNHSIATNHSQINDRPNTTVVKTTVVKTTPKVDATSPVSSKGHGIPKSPTSPVAAAVYGSGVASHHSHTNSSSSSLSSAPQIHQTSVTHESHGPNSGVITKTTTTTVTGLHVTATPSRHPANELPKTPDESGVLGWKADIEMRKKTKSHVPTQRPKEPMKMSEVPEWKKQLQEKNKMKKLSSSDESDVTITRVTTVEMGRVKHEKMVITHGHGGRADHVPEWVRLADEKQKTISH